MTGHKVVTTAGGSMGSAPTTIPSELLPVKGIDYVGPLPPEIQDITVFAAGVPASAKEPDAARALIKFLSSPAAAPVIRKTGMEPS